MDSFKYNFHHELTIGGFLLPYQNSIHFWPKAPLILPNCLHLLMRNGHRLELECWHNEGLPWMCNIYHWISCLKNIAVENEMKLFIKEENSINFTEILFNDTENYRFNNWKTYKMIFCLELTLNRFEMLIQVFKNDGILISFRLHSMRKNESIVAFDHVQMVAFGLEHARIPARAE